MQLEFTDLAKRTENGYFAHFHYSFHEGIYVVSDPSPANTPAFLRIAAGILPQDYGCVRFLGFDIRELGHAYIRHVSASSLFPPCTASCRLPDYLRYISRRQLRTNEEADREAAQICGFLHISNERQSFRLRNEELSARAQMMQTLTSPAPIWLLHEPFSRTSKDFHPMICQLLRQQASKKIILISETNTAALRRLSYREVPLQLQVLTA